MENNTDDIKVGGTKIRYYDAYGAWMLPDKTFTNNPLKAQRVAEEIENKRHKPKQAWEIWEIQFVMEKKRDCNFRSVAMKLDRDVLDVKQLVTAIRAD